jgi:hypothetical protein
VEAEIDLYAAGECDPHTASAVADHLASCPACADSWAQARRLVGLLDLHARLPEQLARLQARLIEEARPPRRARLLPFVRPLRALAALLLVTLGLGLLLTRFRVPAGADLALALAPAAPALVAVRASPKATGSKESPLLFHLDLGGKAEAGFHKKLKADQPPPPTLGLTLRLKNAGTVPLRLTVGGPSFDCVLQLRGPGVVRVPVAQPAVWPFAAARTVTLAPGQEFDLPVERLVSRIGERVSYLYWTEPGDYTLRALVRAPAVRVGSGDGTTRPVTLASPPLTLRVEPGR